MQRDLPRQRGQPGTFTFEGKLEKEEEILEGLLTALARSQLPPEAWSRLHAAAIRDDRLSELAFSYEAVSSGKRLKTQTPAVVAEFLYRAATFFSSTFGDDLGAVGYLERALAAQPAHLLAFGHLAAIHDKTGNHKALADLSLVVAPHRPRAEQIELLRRAAGLYAKDPGGDEKATEIYAQLVRLDPHDETTRETLEARLRKANRHRDVARMAEQALTIDPPLSDAYTRRIRASLIELYTSQLQEPERSMPHVEALLAVDPSDDGARKVASRLLDVKGLAARAASALASASDRAGATLDVAKFLAVELEHTRGPKRREVLRKMGLLRQDKLGDPGGAFEMFEQVLATDLSDEEIRRRFVDLAGALGKELHAAQTLNRIATGVRDASLKARVMAELGKLYMAGGDGKRARATFVGLVGTPDLPPSVSLMAARALCSIYSAEGDQVSLAGALDRVALLEPDEELRQIANEELAELATSVLGDDTTAIAAWTRLVDTTSRARALEALEQLYQEAGEPVLLANVLEERARDAEEEGVARALAFRAAEVLTTRANDPSKASAAWRRVTDRFGAARDVNARWIPLLESQRQWPELASVLYADATLAPEAERAGLYARLGVVRMQKTRDIPGAIDAFRRALVTEPTEKTSRSALERLSNLGEYRLPAALVLEPVYRKERNTAGLLRVLDTKGALGDTADVRLQALDEAADLADRERAIDWIARGLVEAVRSRQPLDRWLERVDRLAPLGSDPKTRATVLSTALGEEAIDSAERLALAKATAEALAATGDVAYALDRYKRALAFEPSSTELLSRVDDLLREQGSPAERVLLYRAALDQDPSPERKRQLLHTIGSIQSVDVGDKVAAIHTFRLALAENPDDHKARSALADLYAETFAWESLSSLLEEHLARTTGEEAKRVRAELAEMASLHGQPNRARAHARALLEEASLSGEHLGALERVAEALADESLLRRILRYRADSAEDSRDRVQSLGRLGDLELSRGARDDAVAAWKHAAEIARQSGDDDATRRLFESVRQVDAHDAEAAFHLAELFERSENWDRLPELYAVLLDHTPLPSVRVSILMRHARVLADKMDDPTGALVFASQAFELSRDAPEHREVLSTFTALALRGKASHIFARAMDDAIARHAGEGPEEAAQRADLRMAKARVLGVDRDGLDAAALAYRAALDDVDMDEARQKAALSAFEALLSREAQDVRVEDRRWLLSWRATHSHERERAAALLSWASAEEWTFGDRARALGLYRRALELEPDNVDILSAISRLALATGDTAGAVLALAARRDRSEGTAKSALELEIATVLLQGTDRVEDALLSVDSVLSSAPQDEDALALAARLLAFPKTHARAVSLLERAEAGSEEPFLRARILRDLLDGKSEPPDPRELRKRWYERLLEAYRGEGRLDVALETALTAVLELPMEHSLLDRAEELARELGRPGEVADVYDRALGLPLPTETAIQLGRRAVAFHEEWFEDSAGAVRILERILQIDMGAQWAFDRLKLLFDAAERWDALFALYDRAALVADPARQADLYEEAAQIAKDFANDSERAITYLEKLLPLRPGNARLVASLERLYERQGSQRELIQLLTSQVPFQAADVAFRTKARVARLWLEEIGDPASALVVIEEMIATTADASGGWAEDSPLFELLEKILAVAPPQAESRASLPPAMEGERGRRDSAPFVKSGKRMPVRVRAASLLKQLYGDARRDLELVRVLEIELEAIRSIRELVRRHRQIAEMYQTLGRDTEAVEHLAALVLLEPHVHSHRAELSIAVARLGRYDRLADTLVLAVEASSDPALEVEILMEAVEVDLLHLSNPSRAIDLLLRVLAVPNVATTVALRAARRVEPLLETAGRSQERLEVMERLAAWEDEPGAKAEAYGASARLATNLGERARAIASLEAQLRLVDDSRALDALIELLDREARWRDLTIALERRVRADRTDAEKRTDLARIARIEQVEIGDQDAAVRAWTELAERFGHTDEGTDALVTLLEDMGRWRELEGLLEHAATAVLLPARRALLLGKLGDVRRAHLGELDAALRSYQEALDADPTNESARSGALQLLGEPALKGSVVGVLMRAYAATDEWRETLALTEHRLTALPETTADGSLSGRRGRVAVLREAAEIAERRGNDAVVAFGLVARAFAENPGDAAVESELLRLAEATGRWAPVAQVYREAIDRDGGSDRRAAWRYRLGEILETRFEDTERALEVYQESERDAPADPSVALAVIRVALRAGRWSAVASTLVSHSRTLGRVPLDLPLSVEVHAQGLEAWDGITSALGAALEQAGDLTPVVVRDLEARLGRWHHERRGDPDLAEAALARALSTDPENAEILSSLLQLQRRARGRPLIESLLRLSRATGGDLDLLREAAELALNTVKDRALAKSILGSLYDLAKERWLSGTAEDGVSARPREALGAASVTVGPPTPCAPLVEWSMRELVRIHEEEDDPRAMLDRLVETAMLPFDPPAQRALMHEAARVAEGRLGDSERAIALYEELVDREANDEEATRSLVVLYEKLGKWKELMALVSRRTRDAATPDRRYELRLVAAGIQRKLGDVDGAVRTLHETLTEAPMHGETCRVLASWYEETGRITELVDLLASQAELALAEGDKSGAIFAWERAARLAEERLSAVDRAVTLYERTIELEERPASLDALARLLVDRGEYARAAAILERLRSAAPERHPELTLRLADALAASGCPEAALAKLEEAIRDNPDDAPIRARLATIYEGLEAWEPLARLLADGASHAPDKPTRLERLLLSATLFSTRSSQPEAAIPLLEQASDLDPSDRSIRLALADALGVVGRFQEARSVLRAIIDGFGGRRPKERAPAHHHLALLELKMGDRARALVELDAATRIDPANPGILRALAELARDDGQLERAERSYRALLVALPRPEDTKEEATIVRTDVLLELSAIAARQGEEPRAREILESALECAAKSEVEGKRLERSLSARADHATLAKALEARLHRSEGAPVVTAGILSDLADVLDAHLGQSERALTARLRAVSLAPGSAAAHEAALELAVRTKTLPRYFKEVERLAEEAEREGQAERAGGLFVRLGEVAETWMTDDARAARLYERAQACNRVTDLGTGMALPAERQEIVTLRALDRVYERLGDMEAQKRILLRRAEVESKDYDPEAAADALYRLAAIVLTDDETVDRGAELLDRAFTISLDAGRTEAILEASMRAHPRHERLVALCERVGRTPGKQRVLVEALSLRSALEGGSREPIREAILVCRELGDPALTESFLRRFIDRSHNEGAPLDVGWALVELAGLRESVGDLTQAIELKQRAAEIAEPEDARRLRLESARLASRVSDLELSATIYRDLLAQDPADREAWEPLLEVYERLERWDALAELLFKVVDYVEDARHRSRLRLDRVRVLMKHLGLGDEAAPLLRDIVDDDPSQVEAAMMLAGIFERQGNVDDLAALLGKQLDGAKDRQDSLSVGTLSLRLGRLLEAKDPLEAKSVLYAGLDWVGQDKEILDLLARIHGRLGQGLERADLLERVLPLVRGEEAELRAIEVHELRKAEGDDEGAERALEVGFRVNPVSLVLGERLERSYRGRGAWEKLAEMFVLDARSRTNSIDRVRRLSDAARIHRNELHQPAVAAALLIEARRDAPESSPLFDELMGALVEAGRHAEAHDQVTAALAAHASDMARRLPLLLKRASLRIELEDERGALADLEEATTLAGDGARPIAAELERLSARAAQRGDVSTGRTIGLLLAAVLSKAGDPEGARARLLDLLRRDAKDREALRALAQIDKQAARWDAVIATYRRLVTLEEGDAVVLAASELADACERIGRQEDARGALERARLVAPRAEGLHERLARLYEHIGAYKELAEMSLSYAAEAKDVAGRFAHLVRAGALLVQHVTDSNVAISALEEAHALRPADMECIVLLADAYTLAGRTADAVELVNVAILAHKGKRSRELSALHHRLARAAHSVGDRASELAWLTSALDVDAQNGFVAAELAQIALEDRHLDLATRALRAVTLLKNPTTSPMSKAVAYQKLGEVAREQGDVKRAVLLLKRALDEDPTLATARALLDALAVE